MKRASGIELDQLDWAPRIQGRLPGQQRTMRIVASASPRVAVQVVQGVFDVVGAHSDASARGQAAQYGREEWVRMVEHGDVGEFGLSDHHLGTGASVVEFGVAERLVQPR